MSTQEKMDLKLAIIVSLVILGIGICIGKCWASTIPLDKCYIQDNYKGQSGSWLICEDGGDFVATDLSAYKNGTFLNKIVNNQ